MTGPCFVDANVLVYAHDVRDPRKHRLADHWINELWRTRQGRLSTQALSEFYVVATRKLGIAAQIAWEETERYFAWQPMAIDETVLRRARELEHGHRLSWWDSLIVAAAQLQDCVLLLTEDLQDGASFGALKVRSPFALGVDEATALYTTPPRLPSLHRPRGRPKRAAASK